MKNSEINHNNINAWIGGLFFPISNFIIALFKPSDYNLKAAFVLFFTFIGSSIYFELGSVSDVSTYVFGFMDAVGYKAGFFDYFNSIPEAQQVDYYMPFMTWFVSRFTTNFRVFLGCLAFVYAIFFYANVNYIVKHFNIRGIGILLLIVFVFVPRINMLTHRWWLALQVFIYGMLPVLYEKKFWSLLWCIATPFIIHFSFFYPLIILVLGIVLPKKSLWPFLLIYLSSIFIDTFNLNAFLPYISNLFNDTILRRTENYINYELLEHNLFSQTATIAINIVNVVLVVYFYFKTKNDIADSRSIKFVFVIALLMGSFASLAAKTEWGWRYYDLSNMLFIFLYLLIITDNNYDKESLKMINYISPLLLYFIFFQIRTFLCIIGPYQLLFGNYFSMWFIHDSSPVWYLFN